MNITTKTFPRVSRGSGTEYASALVRTRRSDASGKIIAVIVIALLGMAWSLS